MKYELDDVGEHLYQSECLDIRTSSLSDPSDDYQSDDAEERVLRQLAARGFTS